MSFSIRLNDYVESKYPIYNVTEEYFHLKGFGRRFVLLKDRSRDKVSNSEFLQIKETLKPVDILVNTAKVISYVILFPMTCFAFILREIGREINREHAVIKVNRQESKRNFLITSFFHNFLFSRSNEIQKSEQKRKQFFNQLGLKGNIQDCLFTKREYLKLYEHARNKDEKCKIVGICMTMAAMCKTQDELKLIPPIVEKLLKDQIEKNKGLNYNFEKVVVLDGLIKLVEKRTGKKFNESFDNALKISYEVLDHKRRLFFHGTNLHSIKSILANGMTPSFTLKDYNLEDLKEIQKIDKKILGVWATKDVRNEYFCVAQNASIAVSYSQMGSPEWFEQFLLKYGGNINDYQKSKNQISRKNNQNMSHTQHQKVNQFFEKYWTYYGNPKIGFVVALETDDHPLSSKKYFEYIKSQLDQCHSIGELEEVLETMNSASYMSIDSKMSETFSPDKLKVFAVPFFGSLLHK